MDPSSENKQLAEWAWIDVLPTSALIISSDRIVLAVNAAAEEEFGYSNEQLVGKPADFLVPTYAWPPAPGGMTLNLAAETASGETNPIDVFIGPADFAGITVEGAYLAMVEDVEYESVDDIEDDRSTRRELLSDIGQIVSSSLDIQSVCEQFSMSVMRSIPTERIAICATPDGSDLYHVIHTVPAAPESHRTPKAPLKVIELKSDALKDAFETHAPVLVTADEITDIVTGDLAPLAWPESATKAIVIVPLMAGSVRVGALLLASSRPDAITADDIDVLGQVAGQVAGTISNLQLHADLKRESSERQLLANVAREANSVVDFSAAIGPIAKELSQSLDIACLEIISIAPSVAGGTLQLVWTTDTTGRPIGTPFEYEGTIEEHVATAAAPFHASGFELLDLRKNYTSPQLSSERWGAFIAVPMMMLSQVVGILTVRSETTQKYSAENIELLTRVADQLAGALQSARMFGRQQKEAEIKRSLAAISVAVSEDLELRRVFERVSDELAVLVMYDHLTLSSMQGDDNRRWQAFSIGVEFNVPGQENDQDDDTDPWAGRSLGTRPDGTLGKAMKKADLSSLIEVPLGTQATGIIGYLTIMNREENAYTERHFKLVAQVAAQVTPAIQNAMAHEQALELAESREKQSLLEAKSAELERVNEAKSQFLAMVSHELRTPLTSIAAYTDLLERNRAGTLNEKQVKQLGIVRRNTTHLNKLITDLLDISKIESSTLSFNKVNFDLGDMILELVESLSPLILAKEQEITAEVTEGIEIVGDKQKITQVISNLIENAVKYSPEGTEITVESFMADDEAVIAITDNGYGIPREDQDRIFETFFRSQTEENWEVPGTGLGLALVKRIVSMHGGVVSLDSEPGAGSTFTIRLPLLSINSDDEDQNELENTDPESPEDAAVTTLRERRQMMLDQAETPESNSDSNAAA